MIIRKLFKFEAAHVVRNCERSRRCSFNIHGHSFQVEVKLCGRVSDLDKASMIKDFGALHRVRNFIDRFDHAYILGPDDNTEFSKFIIGHNERWIRLPTNPSAETLALLFCSVFMSWKDLPEIHSVVVHETATGYAEAFQSDVDDFLYAVDCSLDNIEREITFSSPGKDYVY